MKYIIIDTEEKVFDGKVYFQRIAEGDSLSGAYGTYMRNPDKAIYKHLDPMEDLEIKEK